MASEQARKKNVHRVIPVTSVDQASQKEKFDPHPAVKVGGIEFSSGGGMQQAEQKEKDRDLQRDKQSSHVDQGIRGEGPGDIKFASHGQEQEGPVSKLNTKMQNQVGEEGRVHGCWNLEVLMNDNINETS
ncbi:putative protein isoform X1 [Capsicum annuum]|uniref:uncharacterized protein LOC107842309 isoform X1 n=1 Tax=Capsicum annuum TaxID=4072 RepID=UPI001FB0630E|nr:uncharacterized protein LOC107842309 isoform X1 [Capsicum annuum]